MNSLSYHFIGGATWMFGAHMLTIPPLFREGFQKNDADFGRLLSDFGVTHVVATGDKFIEKLSLLGTSLVQAGPYRVFKLTAPPLPKVSVVTKPVVGYFDPEGTLPFKFVETFFFENRELREQLELVTLDDLSNIPPQVRVLLTPSAFRPASLETIGFDFDTHPPVDHYRRVTQLNIDEATYARARRTLDPFTAKLLSFARPELQAMPEAKLEFRDEGQTIELHNLASQQIYRINYSYSPFWSSDQGTILRGGKERLYFIPRTTEATLTYKTLKYPPVLLGSLISFVAFGSLLWILIFRRSRNTH